MSEQPQEEFVEVSAGIFESISHGRAAFIEVGGVNFVIILASDFDQIMGKAGIEHFVLKEQQH